MKGGKVLKKVLLHFFERYNSKNTLLSKIVVNKFSRRIYKNLYFNYSDRKEIAFLYWGREGGFEHAKKQYYDEESQWKDRYVKFYDLIIDSINSESKIIELGCSCGQLVKRTELFKKNCYYHGIDINPFSIEFANLQFKEYEKIKFFAMDIGDAKLDGYEMIVASQTFFFLSTEAILSILEKVPCGAILIFQEPINSTIDEISYSQIMNDSSKINIGFSHNYLKMLKEKKFNIEFNEKFHDGVLSRILIKAEKRKSDAQ